mmetsp:Transcript_15272/g.32622  ORF Transcript_15272/g.32622 Transcript_15272/m.32622 type:complete len:230 (+) Transcript_15272:495-1184(+)
MTVRTGSERGVRFEADPGADPRAPCKRPPDEPVLKIESTSRPLAALLVLARRTRLSTVIGDGCTCLARCAAIEVPTTRAVCPLAAQRASGLPAGGVPCTSGCCGIGEPRAPASTRSEDDSSVGSLSGIGRGPRIGSVADDSVDGRRLPISDGFSDGGLGVCVCVCDCSAARRRAAASRCASDLLGVSGSGCGVCESAGWSTAASLAQSTTPSAVQASRSTSARLFAGMS